MVQGKYKSKMKILLIIIKTFSFCFLILLVLAFFALSTSPIINKDLVLTPKKTQIAEQIIKNSWKNVLSTSPYLNIEINQSELDAILAVITHTIPSLKLEIRTSNFGAIILASIPLNKNVNIFINASCLFAPNEKALEIEYCNIGSLPLSGTLMQFLLNSFSFVLIDTVTQETIKQLMQGVYITENKITLSVPKNYNFKAQIESSFRSISSTTISLSKPTEVNTERVMFYINKLKSVKQNTKKLAFYIGKLFYFVRMESAHRSPIEENTAAIWALAITFGEPSFASYINIREKIELPGYKPTTLRGRGDLVLHFLYSVILEQMSNTNIGLNIGELKELLDTNNGGSGYSFADLAADKAGLMFSSKLTTSTEQAIYAQNLLANTNNENIFFPAINKLPEGLQENEFKKLFNNINSPEYKKQTQYIDRIISKLALYNDQYKVLNEN